jgi:uncharacterized protein with HEPN domain
MLQDIKNDLVTCLRILNAIGKIKLYSDGFQDPEDFYEFQEQLNFNATLALLGNIGEKVSKISNELKEKYPDINWTQIKAFRNRVIHDYEGVNIVITFEILKNELIILEDYLIEIVKAEIINENFSSDEVKLAKDSKFYKFVNFSKI